MSGRLQPDLRLRAYRFQVGGSIQRQFESDLRGEQR